MVKLCIQNISKNANVKQLQKFIVEKLCVPGDSVTCKKLYDWDHAISEVPSAEDCISKLNGLEWKDKNLRVTLKKVSPVSNRQQVETLMESVTESDIADKVTPLWKLSYEEQIKVKQTEADKVIKSALSDMSKSCEKKFKFTQSEIVKSPMINGYRNKCEFAFGKDCDGNKSIGYISKSRAAVFPSENCLNIPSVTRALLMKVNDYLQACRFEPFDEQKRTGVFRLLMIRALASGELMMTLQIFPETVSQSDIEEIKASFVEIAKSFSLNDEDKELKVNSLMFQCSDSVYNVLDNSRPFECLYGSLYIAEDLMGLKFQISSASFFQVNTFGAKVLYETIGELAQLDKDVVLLDLCCGTGTIGQVLASKVKRVIGVEMITEAIEDAKVNCSLNGIDNAEFICGKVESVIKDVLYKISPEERVVAILDPPRNGIHKNVIRAIRSFQGIKHIVYAACSPKQAKENFVQLCRSTSNQYEGNPFEPERWIPMDMFPHTDHYELLVSFKRE